MYDASKGTTSKSDSVPIEAYDGNMTTYAGPYSMTYKYMKVDSSAWGKTINVRTSGNYTSWGFAYGSGNAPYDSRSTSIDITLPSNITYFLLYGNESNKFYEITVKN